MYVSKTNRHGAALRVNVVHLSARRAGGLVMAKAPCRQNCTAGRYMDHGQGDAIHQAQCSAGGLASHLTKSLFTSCQNSIFLSQQSAKTVFFSPAEQAHNFITYLAQVMQSTR